MVKKCAWSTCKSDSRKPKRLFVKAEDIAVKFHRFLLGKKHNQRAKGLLSWMQSYASNYKYGDQLGVLLFKDALATQLGIALGASATFAFSRFAKYIREEKYTLQMIHYILRTERYTRACCRKLQNGSNDHNSATESRSTASILKY